MIIVRKKHVTDITPADISGNTILLDIDNTLALQDDKIPYKETINWCSSMQKAGFTLVVVSNNSEGRVKEFAALYSLPYVSNARKPLPYGFNKAMKKMAVNRKNCTVVGDQIFTDFLGALFAGMNMILLEPLEEEKYGYLKTKRKIDKFVRKIIFGGKNNDRKTSK